MKLIKLGAALISALALNACGGVEEPPTKREVTKAMQTYSGQVVDQLLELGCVNSGPSKFLCDYTIVYIGAFPESRRDCMFASAAGWTPMPAYRCE